MMFIQKLSEREKKILYAVVALIIFVVLYHGAWVPVSAKFSDLDEKIFSLQLAIRKAKIFIHQKDEILTESKKYQNLEQMDAGKDEEEIAKLLNLIEQTARKTGVALSDVKPQLVKSDKISKRFVVELNAESGIQPLMDFIYQLRHSEQILKIERVDITPIEDKSTILRSYLVITRVVVR